jgi:Papain family cysteine protease
MKKFALGWQPHDDERDKKYPMTLALPGDIERNIPESVMWKLGPILDQGDQPHCVGYAWKQWQQCTPLQTLDGPSAEDIYNQCKVIDGNNEEGSNTSSGVKAMSQEGRLQTYLWAFDLDTFKKWILTQGPIVIGACWYMGMYETDENNYVKPGGEVAGGHEFLCYGYDATKRSFKFCNSWSEEWGDQGTFWMKEEDVEWLLWNNPDMPGDACAAVEKKLEPIS